MQMSPRRQTRRVSALLFGVTVASCWSGETYVEVVRGADDIEVGAYLITHHYITEQLVIHVDTIASPDRKILYLI
jgi:hypothetical protein